MDVYDRIDAVLKEKHMSRRQLAIAAGIPESSLAAGFSRRSKMPPETLEKICGVLRVSPGDLEPRLRPLYEIFEDGAKLKEHLNASISIIEYISVMKEDLKEAHILDKLLAHDETKQDLLYSILSCALALNKEGINKVMQYMLDISQIMSYQEQSARILSQTIHAAIQEVRACPEDAPQTAADCNPGSVPMDAGNADSRPE